jgi:hypothetical protein
MIMKYKSLILSFAILLAACSTGQAPVQMNPGQTEQPLPTQSITAQATEAVNLASTNSTAIESTAPPAIHLLNAEDWKEWPVIPELSPHMLDVYIKGLELGRNPRVISVVGDCESSSDWFLKDFSKGERYYNLGEYAHLQKTIEYFNPSLGYQSYAAFRGATATTVLTSLWADPKACDSGETPLGCEYRTHNPAFAFIALGTNDVHKPEQFEKRLRQIIEYTLDQGIIPILVTKADNVEGDESINLAIAQLSIEYAVPVWNFWAAVQALPDQGLQEDGVHLTFASNDFSDPEKLQRAWPVRNLSALQVLEVLRLMATQE